MSESNYKFLSDIDLQANSIFNTYNICGSPVKNTLLMTLPDSAAEGHIKSVISNDTYVDISGKSDIGNIGVKAKNDVTVNAGGTLSQTSAGSMTLKSTSGSLTAEAETTMGLTANGTDTSEGTALTIASTNGGMSLQSKGILSAESENSSMDLKSKDNVTITSTSGNINETATTGDITLTVDSDGSNGITLQTSGTNNTTTYKNKLFIGNTPDTEGDTYTGNISLNTENYSLNDTISTETHNTSKITMVGTSVKETITTDSYIVHNVANKGTIDLLTEGKLTEKSNSGDISISTEDGGNVTISSNKSGSSKSKIEVKTTDNNGNVDVNTGAMSVSDTTYTETHSTSKSTTVGSSTKGVEESTNETGFSRTITDSGKTLTEAINLNSGVTYTLPLNDKFEVIIGSSMKLTIDGTARNNVGSIKLSYNNGNATDSTTSAAAKTGDDNYELGAGETSIELSKGFYQLMVNGAIINRIDAAGGNSFEDAYTVSYNTTSSGMESTVSDASETATRFENPNIQSVIHMVSKKLDVTDTATFNGFKMGYDNNYKGLVISKNYDNTPSDNNGSTT